MATMFPQTLGAEYVGPYAAAIAAQRARLEQPQAPAFTPEQQAQRVAQNQRLMELGLLGRLSGDQGFGEVGGEVLRQAVTARTPRVTERGTADPLRGTFTYSPDYLREKDEAELKNLERASAAVRGNRQSQLDAAAERRERDREKFENQKELRVLMRSLGGGGGGGSFSPAGFTPDGRRTVVNSKTGLEYVVGTGPNDQPTYTPVTGPTTPKATFDKAVVDAQEGLAAAARADRLLKAVQGNPGAFGMAGAAVSVLPGVMQGRAGQALGLTAEQRKLRAQVTRDASMELKEIYGAAQSAGELARASAWAPNSGDDFDDVINKLEAARNWALESAQSKGVGVQRAAQGRSGGVRDDGMGGAGEDDPLNVYANKPRPGR